MRKLLFVMSHIGSGWEEVVERLSRRPNVEFFGDFGSYHHYDDLLPLTKHSHKNNNALALFGDVILHDKDMSFLNLCSSARFLFWTKPYDSSIEKSFLRSGFSKTYAQSYYEYRAYGLQKYYQRCKYKLWNPDLADDVVLDSILR